MSQVYAVFMVLGCMKYICAAYVCDLYVQQVMCEKYKHVAMALPWHCHEERIGGFALHLHGNLGSEGGQHWDVHPCAVTPKRVEPEFITIRAEFIFSVFFWGYYKIL